MAVKVAIDRHRARASTMPDHTINVGMSVLRASKGAIRHRQQRHQPRMHCCWQDLHMLVRAPTQTDSVQVCLLLCSFNYSLFQLLAPSTSLSTTTTTPVSLQIDVFVFDQALTDMVLMRAYEIRGPFIKQAMPIQFY